MNIENIFLLLQRVRKEQERELNENQSQTL